jgi:hypothetical protein
MEPVKELIRTAVIFTPGQQIKPAWFEWRRRQHRIIRTTYHWQEQHGATKLLHFSVTDGEALYKLIYNTNDQNWLLQGFEVT